ncbi:MAG: DNA-3-methyladenine glycosylase [Flavobacteriales bacterium]|nr:DNA-3-methyladenine glycosylase [Flavobacteriales bacterium]MBK9287839.1 DNA-3-methyladenine glycosylase [Flavobacteriales bacterium]
MKQLPRSFYLATDVVDLARELLGKVILTEVDGLRTSAIITETEAYAGETDKASHAFGGRRTARTEVMYAQGGTAYVYLCYGIHHLFNVVTNQRDVPHAVLVRAAAPLEGITVMHDRLGRGPGRLLKGPGVVSKALGIRTALSGSDLINGPIRILDADNKIDLRHVRSGPRIGVDYAGADALLPYRSLIDPDLLK